MYGVLVSAELWGLWAKEVMSSTPMESYKFYTHANHWRGATWQPMTGPRGTI
jgi:hypothetical protein